MIGPINYAPASGSASPKERMPQVTLVSENRAVSFPKSKLIEKIPYFKMMLVGGFKEANQDRVDVNNFLTAKELKLLSSYLKLQPNEKLKIKSSNSIELFTLFDKLLLEDLKPQYTQYFLSRPNEAEALQEPFYIRLQQIISTYLKKKATKPVQTVFAKWLDRDWDHLSVDLECRTVKVQGSGPNIFEILNNLQSEYIEYLKGEGIAELLNGAKILKAGFQSINIYSANDEDLPKFLKQLKGTVQLKSLAISCLTTKHSSGVLSNLSASPLSEAIKTLNCLENLEISNQGFTNRGITRLANALANHPSIKTIKLPNNNITDKSVKCLSKLLRKNRSLKTVHLEHNAFTEKGAEKLNKVIRKQRNREIRMYI